MLTGLYLNTVSRHEIGTHVYKDHNWLVALRIIASRQLLSLWKTVKALSTSRRPHQMPSPGTVKLREGSLTALQERRARAGRRGWRWWWGWSWSPSWSAPSPPPWSWRSTPVLTGQVRVTCYSITFARPSPAEHSWSNSDFVYTPQCSMLRFFRRSGAWVRIRT